MKNKILLILIIGLLFINSVNAAPVIEEHIDGLANLNYTDTFDNFNDWTEGDPDWFPSGSQAKTTSSKAHQSIFNTGSIEINNNWLLEARVNNGHLFAMGVGNDTTQTIANVISNYGLLHGIYTYIPLNTDPDQFRIMYNNESKWVNNNATTVATTNDHNYCEDGWCIISLLNLGTTTSLYVNNTFLGSVEHSYYDPDTYNYLELFAYHENTGEDTQVDWIKLYHIIPDTDFTIFYLYENGTTNGISGFNYSLYDWEDSLIETGYNNTNKLIFNLSDYTNKNVTIYLSGNLEYLNYNASFEESGNIYVEPSPKINLSATNGQTSQNILVFNASLYNSSGGLIFSNSTSNGNIYFNMKGQENDNYNLTLSSLNELTAYSNVSYSGSSVNHNVLMDAFALVLNFSSSVNGVYVDTNNTYNFTNTSLLVYLGIIPYGEVNVRFNPSSLTNESSQFYEFIMDSSVDSPYTENVVIYDEIDSEYWFKVVDENNIPIKNTEVRVYSSSATTTTSALREKFRGQQLTDDQGYVKLRFDSTESILVSFYKQYYGTVEKLIFTGDLEQSSKADAEIIELSDNDYFSANLLFFGTTYYDINTTNLYVCAYAPSEDNVYAKTTSHNYFMNAETPETDTYCWNLTEGTHFNAVSNSFNLTLYDGNSFLNDKIKTVKFTAREYDELEQLFLFTGVSGKIFSIMLLIAVLLVSSIARWKFNTTTAGFNIYMVGLVIIGTINNAFMWSAITSGIYFATKTLYKVINK